jgi:hypothetical protein
VTPADGWTPAGASPAAVKQAIGRKVDDRLGDRPPPGPAADPAPPAVGTNGGHLVLRANTRPMWQVSVALRETPSVTGGVGGWTTVDRPGRDPIAWWSGGVAYTLTINGVLDAHHHPAWDDEDLPARLQRLYALGRRSGGRLTPPSIVLLGDTQDQHTRDGGEWVMTALTPGQRVHRRGRLASVEVDIELASYEFATPVTGGAVRRTRRTATSKAKRVVTTRRGDTVRGVAIRELGQQSAWSAIIKANGRLKGVMPDEPLRPGMRLVMP